MTTAKGRFIAARSGDCISSLAEEHGLWWKSIWDHPDNQELREARKDPNVLFPGDKVYIRELERKQCEGSTEKRHRFRRRGVPAKVCIRILVEHQPVANTPYAINIDGIWRDGNTNDEGDVIESIPQNAQKALLQIKHEGETLEFDFRLGRLDPEQTILGVQQRLNNLGYASGTEDGILGPVTREALKRFQHDHKLEETGEPDDATLGTLRSAHEDGAQRKVKAQEEPPTDNMAEDWFIAEDEEYPERGMDVETLPDDFDPEEDDETLDDGYEGGEYGGVDEEDDEYNEYDDDEDDYEEDAEENGEDDDEDEYEEDDDFDDFDGYVEEDA